MWNSASFLGAVGSWGALSAAVFATLAAISGLVAALAANRASDIRNTEANIRIAEAHATAEDANARALEATLELARFREPRQLNEEQRRAIATDLRDFTGQKFTASLASSSQDARLLWASLEGALRDAGWQRVEPAGFASGEPPAGIVIEAISGVRVIAANPTGQGTINAGRALAGALEATGIAAQFGGQADPKETRPNVIWIVIGLKPD